MAGRTAPAHVGDRAEAGHRRSGGDPSLRHPGRQPRPPRLPVPADLCRHRRHQPEAVERVEGPPAGRPLFRHPARAARRAGTSGAGGRARGRGA
ncbi:hypothetical protein G6F22_017071 [Rhizopus arrhizus]|nr:hypothetical protein G6F22_017071 [Rhizopus arrhizus]